METNNGGETPQSSTVKPIWETAWSQSDAVATPVQEEVKPADVQTKDTVVEGKTEPELNLNTEVPELAKEENAGKTEEKPAVDSKSSDELVLTVDDIKDAPKTYADKSFQKFAYDVMAVDVAEDSLEAVQKAFQEKYVSIDKLKEVETAGKERFYSSLKPETATAFELIELGVPEELAFNPTKEIDGYLKLEDAVLVRAVLENQQGWTEDMVDIEMEELSSNPSRLVAKANIARANLNAERNEILNERSQLVQKYTQQKQQVALQQKTEAETRFKEALTNESTFMGLPLSKEIKDAIIAKRARGAYDNVLSDARAQALAILQVEFGDKFTKTALSKAKEEGKADIVKKLAEIPSKKSGGGSVVINAEQTKGAFSNMPNVFTQ